MYQPPNFAVVTPYIIVHGAAAFIEFVLHAFSAEEIGRTEKNGRILNAQINISDCAIMVAEAKQNLAAMPSAYYLYVDDVDDTMATAQAAGGELVFVAKDMPYGDRQGGIKDPFGNYWWISKRLEHSSYYD